jgi:hypothetical protein
MKTNYSILIEQKQKNEMMHRKLFHSSLRMTTTETNTRKIINNFMNNVDNNKSYTLKQLDNVLCKSYKTYENKKAPTAYNMYIKEKMAELKSTNSALTAKELMKMAALGWSEQKKQNQDSNTIVPVIVPETVPVIVPETVPETVPPPSSPVSPEPEPVEEPKTPRTEPTPPKAPNAPKKATRKAK